MQHTNRRIIGQRIDGQPIIWMRGATISFLIDDGDSGGDAFDDQDDGDEDDQDDQDDGDEDDQDDGDKDDQDEDTWTPPSHEEWQAMQRALKASTAQATERRRWLQQLGVNPRTGRPATSAGQQDLLDTGEQDGDDGADQTGNPDPTTDRGETTDRESELLQGIKEAQLAAALARLGWSGDDEMVYRLIDFGRIELHHDGPRITVTGLDEQIEAIRTKIPAWFAGGAGTPKSTTRRGGNAVDGGTRRAPKTTRTWRDHLSQQMGVASGR